MWFAPSLVEVELVVCSLLVSWSWCLYPSSVEVDCGASVEFVLVEREVRYSRLYLYKILDGGSLGGSPRWTKLVDWKSFSVKAGM